MFASAILPVFFVPHIFLFIAQNANLLFGYAEYWDNAPFKCLHLAMLASNCTLINVSDLEIAQKSRSYRVNYLKTENCIITEVVIQFRTITRITESVWFAGKRIQCKAIIYLIWFNSICLNKLFAIHSIMISKNGFIVRNSNLEYRWHSNMEYCAEEIEILSHRCWNNTPN